MLSRRRRHVSICLHTKSSTYRLKSSKGKQTAVFIVSFFLVNECLKSRFERCTNCTGIISRLWLGIDAPQSRYKACRNTFFLLLRVVDELRWVGGAPHKCDGSLLLFICTFEPSISPANQEQLCASQSGTVVCQPIRNSCVPANQEQLCRKGLSQRHPI